jgi:hypothetical protein
VNLFQESSPAQLKVTISGLQAATNYSAFLTAGVDISNDDSR